MPVLRPRLVVTDAPRAIAFYREAFGAEQFERFTGDGGVIAHAGLRIGTAELALKEADAVDQDPHALGGTAVLLSLDVPTPADVDATVEAATASGATVVFPVEDREYGMRDARIEDPFGHLWLISSALAASPSGG